MKIEGTNAEQQSRTFGRHFEAKDQLMSKISRESINALKSHFADEMTKDDWRLVGGGGGMQEGGRRRTPAARQLAAVSPRPPVFR